MGDTFYPQWSARAASLLLAVTCGFWLLLSASIAIAAERLPAGERERHAERWQQIQTALFPGSELHDAEGVLRLTAPSVAKDPALVPVTIEALIPQTEQRHIKKITLLIDHNPAPLAAVFHLTPRSGVAHLKTRVRVNEFSYVRAVAETNLGEFFVAKDFVRASGGCDVPPRIDVTQIQQRLGTMKLRLPGGARRGQNSVADLLINHPNYNGMQVGNTAGAYIPARLVQQIEVAYGDNPLLTIDGHMSLSEDPRFRFHYVPEHAGELSVRLVDSDDTRFQQSWAVAVSEPESSDSGSSNASLPSVTVAPAD